MQLCLKRWRSTTVAFRPNMRTACHLCADASLCVFAHSQASPWWFMVGSLPDLEENSGTLEWLSWNHIGSAILKSPIIKVAKPCEIWRQSLPARGMARGGSQMHLKNPLRLTCNTQWSDGGLFVNYSSWVSLDDTGRFSEKCLVNHEELAKTSLRKAVTMCDLT